MSFRTLNSNGGGYSLWEYPPQQSIDEFDLSGCLNGIVDIIRRHEIVLPAKVAMLLKVLIMLEGTAQQLSPRFNLAELIEPMGMLSIATDKAEQVAEAVAPAFEVIDHREIVYRHDCDAQVIGDLVGMGPSAFHRTTREIADAAAALTNGGTTALPVTVAVTATVCRPAQRIDAS